MTIGPDDVRRIARLAALKVEEAELPTLVRELDQIVEYVSQLRQLAADPASGPVVGPSSSSLRADRPTPPDLTRPAGDGAPAFRDGFFVVPKLEALDR